MPFPKRDNVGERFGRLVIAGDAPRKDQTKHRCVACRCDCGETVVVRYATLRSGRTRSCGCLQRENLAAQHESKQRDLSGQSFGRLTVVERAPSRKVGRKWHGYWKCQCECGTETVVQRSSLTSGATRSCGCLFIEYQSERAETHGGSRTPEYKIWAAIIQRCTNPNQAAYKDYGGRGIRICDQWRASFKQFISDVGWRPEPGLELDRQDNNGHYEPGNVRWVTKEKNRQNRTFVSRAEAESLKAEVAALKARLKELEDTP